MKLKATDATLL